MNIENVFHISSDLFFVHFFFFTFEIDKKKRFFRSMKIVWLFLNLYWACLFHFFFFYRSASISFSLSFSLFCDFFSFLLLSHFHWVVLIGIFPNNFIVIIFTFQFLFSNCNIVLKFSIFFIVFLYLKENLFAIVIRKRIILNIYFFFLIFIKIHFKIQQ